MFAGLARRPPGLNLTIATRSVVAVEQPPADLEGHECIDGGVLHLLVGEVVRIPGANPHRLRLLDVGVHDSCRDALEARVAEVPALHLLRREVRQVHRVAHLQAVVVAEPLGVRLHAHADERVAGVVAEELGQRDGDVAGAEYLEDEAAAPDAELEDGCFAVRAAEAGTPLDVQPDDELVQAAAVDGENLVEPALHVRAGGRYGGGDQVFLEPNLVHPGGGHWIRSPNPDSSSVPSLFLTEDALWELWVPGVQGSRLGRRGPCVRAYHDEG